MLRLILVTLAMLLMVTCAATWAEEQPVAPPPPPEMTVAPSTPPTPPTPPAAAPAGDRAFHAVIKLSMPKKKSDRAGGADDEVVVDIWLPQGVQTIRGAVVNPFYNLAVTQKHWQEVCRLWDFALVGANYFGVRKEDFGPTLTKALAQFADDSGHPELARLPLCFVGMSAGAGMSMQFAAAMPERTIAVAPVCLEVGPTDAATRAIPTVTIFGEKDMRQPAQLAEKLPVQRAEGALWATAIQWGQGHEFALANNLVMPWFDRVIRARYPVGATPLEGPVTLAPLAESDGWLGDPATWDAPMPSVAAFADYAGDKAAACWLPDAYLAAAWCGFVAKKPGVVIRRPAGQGDKADFQPHPAAWPVVVSVEVTAGRATSVEVLDGDRTLARTDAAPCDVAIGPLAPGVHALLAVATLEDGRRLVSRPHTIIVTGKPAAPEKPAAEPDAKAEPVAVPATTPVTPPATTPVAPPALAPEKGPGEADAPAPAPEKPSAETGQAPAGNEAAPRGTSAAPIAPSRGENSP